MSRRRRADKRIVDPDPKFGNLLIAKFINKLMVDGKKSVARRILYGALDRFCKKIGTEEAVAAFEKAIENVKPIVAVKSRRVGGATYQVPIEVPADRRVSLAFKWIINFSRAKPGRRMEDALAMELVDCHNGQGASIKKRDETHRTADANKAFAHYKW